MRLTQLEIVQHILSALGSDEVSSYDETVESYQVALLVKQAFYDCAVELGLPEHESLYQLEASGDNAKPCIMFIPTVATRLDTIMYDNKLASDTNSKMEKVEWMDWEDFIRMQAALGGETTNVAQQVVTNNAQSFNIMYRTNAFPRYYTTTDENTLIFDGFDNTVDTTLAKAKSMAYGAVYPSYTLNNSSYPDLNPSQFPYLIAKAKTRAFKELKQQDNAESASETRKQKIVVQKRQQLVKKDPAIYDVFRTGRK